jgi:hypothetical protein
MRKEYNIDHLYTYKTISADPNRLVPNPHKKTVRKESNRIKSQIDKYMKEYGELTLQQNEESKSKSTIESKVSDRGKSKHHSNIKSNRSSTDKSKVDSKNKSNVNSKDGNNSKNSKESEEPEIIEIEKKIKELQIKQYQLKEKIKGQPEKIKIGDIMNNEEIVMLETERKIIIDTIKMLCYRAETELFNLIYPFFSRQEDEGRAFIKSLFYLSGDLIPDEEGGRILIKHHTLANRRSNIALKEVCRLMNDENAKYPGTDKLLIYESQKDELRS